MVLKFQWGKKRDAENIRNQTFVLHWHWISYAKCSLRYIDFSYLLLQHIFQERRSRLGF